MLQRARRRGAAHREQPRGEGHTPVRDRPPQLAFSDTQRGAEASCGIYSIVCTARANGLMPMRYLEWLLDEMTNMADVSDKSALERLLPWSEAVPASCRMTPSEAAAPDPMAAPVIEVDPHTLDEG